MAQDFHVHSKQERLAAIEEARRLSTSFGQIDIDTLIRDTISESRGSRLLTYKFTEFLMRCGHQDEWWWRREKLISRCGNLEGRVSHLHSCQKCIESSRKLFIVFQGLLTDDPKIPH